MARMRNDPNFNVCPDYASDVFQNTRAQLINENTNEERAVQLLTNIWETNNDADKIAWQHQVAADREERLHREQLEEEEQERLEQVRAQEEEATCKEDRKKNKHKYILILPTGIPNDAAMSITPCAYAIKKLDKGEYVELWYFTNDGLDEVNRKETVDDDAMIMSTLADGSTAWVSAASTRNARAVINDENLPFEEFCQACPCMLTAMEEADWPEDRTRMMARFWRNIQVHKFRSMRNSRWHVAVKTSVGPYDLSLVNERVLEETREKVYWETRDKRDNTRDYKVSFSTIKTRVCAHQIFL
ncbi:hypothetical protein CY34DRAFT_27078 [Suillus luteus UH-Slu-Lm8-n1]|uniref:Uncharacterized protein n=1 Tax=Suillus luteus UH-Slu-Lm8-n1 TaxID=930992 RepID=A0A0D0A4Q7_9AGAM|nr:hypothetical protein CY34DRAFT_27078 [Suillus luteus UH-Slu-Lm8-n1]